MRTEVRPIPVRLFSTRTALAAAVIVGLAAAIVPGMPAAAEGGDSGSYAYRDDHPVIISEIAPGFLDRPAASFVELRNVSDAPVDLTGWTLYRCNGEGLRAKRGNPDSELTGVVLAPGDVHLIARTGERPGGAVPDDVFGTSFDPGGVGYVLEDPAERTADAVAIYPTEPWMTTSECGPSGSLPGILDVMAGETYQRTGAGVEAEGRFIVATGTPGSAALGESLPPSRESGVVIAEAAPFGPGGSGDDLVELRNDADRTASLAGWTLWRCTARGERTADTLQLRLGPEHRLAPGGRLVIAGPASTLDEVDAVMPTSLADDAFGLQLRDDEGMLVDELAVAHHGHSACQSGEALLPARLDAVRGESHQRIEPGLARVLGPEFLIAPRTPGARNAALADALADAVPIEAGVVVSELATDPLDVAAIARPHNFVELANRSTAPVSLEGWRVWACGADGRRRAEPLGVLGSGTILAPGGVAVLAAAGTPAAEGATAVFAEPLAFLGAGVLVENAEGELVDRVGAFHVNEMDESIEPPSPCTNGVSLVTFQPDRVRGESYARVERTGVDLVDFATGAASPGVDGLVAGPVETVASRLLEDVRSTARGMLRPPASDPAVALAAAAEPSARTAVALPSRTAGAEPARLVAGTTGAEPAVRWSLDDERAVGIPPTDEAGAEPETGPEPGRAPDSPRESEPAIATAEGWAYPALRLEYAAPIEGTVRWEGIVGPRHRALLSAWSEAEERWSPIGEALADGAGDVVVTATTPSTTALLVQMLPGAAPDRTPDGALEPLDAIDGTLVHLTDTQYLAEGYPQEYDRMTDWIARLAERRPVAAAIHTGDLVQSWVDPDQSPDRARIEFARASEAQSILERAGVATTVLPGNHDTKRGMDAGLFNEHFGPERYRDQPGYVAPIAPGDNTSSYSIVEAGPAPMLILSIGYGYGERELEWAERVVGEHPDHNIVIATHEHLTPLTEEGPARRAAENRWVSRADALWERVIAPNRHVVAVLAGHYHGLGAIVTPDAGGIEGHDVVELLADYQEFRTASGERATGFLRLLQLDLAAGMLAVDTYSPRLAATAAHPYDAIQFLTETGDAGRAANGRPWNIMSAGLNERYTVADDEFAVELALQYDKRLAMTGVTIG
ncbi:lamin tail domain-containing protein [Microcella daejeonensis]|uniref:Lamin tail domain-containing protein n=1 Tax=Microcella daejeonensis TaxID=2994971 RepID=A0A9E8S8Z4_9MICO|nr:metallophosphoesterase [Microcella daejeonensis]WAB81803.1 lamin tail domain-containing protein [Microcella daejeonensis]